MKMKSGKISMLVVLSFMFMMCTTYVHSDDKPTISRTFTIDTPGNIEVRTSGGGITVEGVDGDQVEVKAYVRKQGRLLSADDSEFDKAMEGYELRIEKIGNKVSAVASRESGSKWWNNVSISFHVTAPHEVACVLRTSGGSLKLTEVIGVQSLNTSGGSIHLEKINGQVTAKTSGGSIKVMDQKGDAEVRTSGGSIKISNVDGNVNGHTSGGGIRIENVNGAVDVHTSGGGITVTGKANSVKASTSGGGITVDVSNLTEALELKTSGGGITAKIPHGLGLDLDLKANRVHIDLENFSGTAEKDKTYGEMNGGGIPVYMRTSGGNINVAFR